MDVTYLKHVKLSGPFTPLTLHWSGKPTGARFPLTFNQRNHVVSVSATGRSSWIGGTVGIPESVSTSSVAEAVRSVIAGADALRTVADSAHNHEQQAFAPEALTVAPGETVPDVPSSLQLEALIADLCKPGGVPGVFLARCGQVLLFGIDHFHADMLSVVLLQRRLYEAMNGIRTQEAPAFLGIASPVHDHQPQTLEVWRDFFNRTDNQIPPFPVDFGVPESELVTPVHDVRHVLGSADVDSTSDLDQRTFAVVLTCLAEVLEPLSGQEEFATVIPVHTRGRRDDPRHGVVGWMVSNAPVIARAGDVDGTARWLHDAVSVAGLPLETMVENLRPTLPTGVIPMVSYMDFRRLNDDVPQARYISSASPTDTVQFWFSRTSHGLDLRTKYPDTHKARRIISEILDALEQALRTC